MKTENPSANPLLRPTLLPGLRRLWRSPHRLQLGVDPSRAVVLELPTAATARVLDLLDGTRSERRVLSEARRCGISERDARAMIDNLRSTGLVVGAHTLLPQSFPDPVRRRLAAEAAALALRGAGHPGTPAQILRRRAAAKVAVTGGGRLAAAAAVTLAQAGVGHVAPAFDHPAEARQTATAIATLAPGTRTTTLRRRDTTFVVQAGGGDPAGLSAARYRRIAHLSLVIRDGTVVVGPLVPPRGAPCLNCLDLHRRDRDPDWPGLAPQLANRPELEPCEATTTLTAAGLAASEVLSWVDGATPTTLGGCVEIAGPARLRRRSWPPHPACRCTVRRRRPGAAVVAGADYGTMAR